jgi:hypothetical protein
MAKSTAAPKGEGPPDPKNSEAFRDWLAKQPREWSVTVAARAALRVLPLANGANVLSVFRATAIARFAAKYPNQAIATAAVTTAAAVASFSAASAATPSAVKAAAYAADAANAYGAYAGPAALATTHAGDVNVAVYSAVKHDAQRLHDGVLTAEQLAGDQLWPISAPTEFAEAWQWLLMELHARGEHWQVWTDWYQNIALHEPHRGISKAEDAAYTDIPGELPWAVGYPGGDGGDAAAVNKAIAVRLEPLRKRGAVLSGIPVPKLDSAHQKTETLARLAEIVSPLPTITDRGQLHAGPNQPFDVPM